ncbi:MAG: hypothetical protein IJ469_08140 [Candidatus Methanomethylophilaceae archaeon]|nr:hypothetical protein [Candidatus Methanomethylophilaceae archaeon]
MKAQMKAILASFLVIVLALSAVSGITYSWWSDSENTDITVDTGYLDVEVSDIKYSMEPGSSGFFTVDKKSPSYEGKTASLSLITDLSNVAPNDIYYIDYTVQFETTVYAAYTVNVHSDVDWIDVEVEDHSTSTVQTPSAGDVELNEWTLLPESGSELDGSAVSASRTVRVTITVEEDVPRGGTASVGVINLITQSQNSIWNDKVPGSLGSTTLEVTPGGGTKTGTITVYTPSDLIYLNTLAEEWVSLYSNGKGTDVSCYRESEGGRHRLLLPMGLDGPSRHRSRYEQRPDGLHRHLLLESLRRQRSHDLQRRSERWSAGIVQLRSEIYQRSDHRQHRRQRSRSPEGGCCRRRSNL